MFGFGKKENRLEQLLREATRDAGKRPAFVKELLQSTLIVLGEAGGLAPHLDGGFVTTSDSKFTFKQYQIGDAWAFCVYSSESALQEAQMDKEPHLKLHARDFLSFLAPEHKMVLNAGCAYGKTFLGPEIQSLLKGESEGEKHGLAAGSGLVIGEPRERPEKALDAVKSYLSRRQDVEKAYLAATDFNDGAGVHYLLALKLKNGGKIDEIASDLIAIARETIHSDQMIDIIDLIPGDGLSQTIEKDLKPFFPA